ncbi:hypothetical protein [Embleya sp. MST-111070]|uniref:hypothetical protein n=1 Tax=Embleya sp. MST-111070 TaxID=3398231 RepID=UPI003F741042
MRSIREERRPEDDGIPTDHAMAASPVAFVAAPKDESVLAEVRKYQTCMITETQEREEYREFLEKALKPLGIYRDKFLPGVTSSCYKVTFDGRMAAIFRLTPAAPDSIYHEVIPGAAGRRIIEVNNVAIEQSFKGDLLLGIIMRNCALLSHAKGFDYVAGLIRHEILPMFVDFGTIPVRHAPLHLLGDETICDYVTYFMTDRKEHVDYAVSRSYHYFHRKVTMKRIAADVAESTLCPTDALGG